LDQEETMTCRAVISMLTLAILMAGCDSPPTVTAPAATPAPAPPPPSPALPGWNGTFVSSNWSLSPFPIHARFERTGNTVKGSWGEVVWLDFGGTIEGTLDGTRFAGTVTINECRAPVQGTLTETRASWSSAAVENDCSVFGMPSPLEITIELSR
jgi:hypothetical protein